MWFATLLNVARDLTLFCISLFVNCSYNVIIQGKGFPDVNTRMMVRCLWSTLQIPILALVDADPHGNLKRFAFFTLYGGVAMSPPKYESLLKKGSHNKWIDLAFPSTVGHQWLCSLQILVPVKNTLYWINYFKYISCNLCVYKIARHALVQHHGILTQNSLTCYLKTISSKGTQPMHAIWMNFSFIISRYWDS